MKQIESAAGVKLKLRQLGRDGAARVSAPDGGGREVLDLTDFPTDSPALLTIGRSGGEAGTAPIPLNLNVQRQ